MKFNTAQQAFEFFYQDISDNGHVLQNTKYLPNIGFYLTDTHNAHIHTPWRKWKASYAELEWQWYLSGSRDVSEIKKQAKIWDTMHNGNNLVNSNYGYQWNRNKQIDFIVRELHERPFSRRAVLTIYDGKEHTEHEFDTPCTLNIMFTVSQGKLNMSVMMRSNDLWFGFCNDQYCFSKLQHMIANRLNRPVGWYYHFANNLHLYNQHLNKKI